MSTDTRQQILIFIPGILDFPFDSRNWDARGQTWANRHKLISDRTDYFCGPLSRAWHQERRVERVKNTLFQYPAESFDRTIVAHSNGTDLALKALAEMDWPSVGELHLISGACQADFNKNGLNSALLKGRIEKVHVYIGDKDWALRLSHFCGWVVGFGTLGWHGPINVWPTLKNNGQLDVHHEPDFGHSSWFEPARFDDTMLRVTSSMDGAVQPGFSETGIW